MIDFILDNKIIGIRVCFAGVFNQSITFKNIYKKENIKAYSDEKSLF
jgi:hypothetical protein